MGRLRGCAGAGVAVVGEGMTSGAFVAPVVADIVDYYYGQSDALETYQPENTLIP